MDRHYIVNGYIITEWTPDEIHDLVKLDKVALYQVLESSGGHLSFYYHRTKVVIP